MASVLPYPVIFLKFIFMIGGIFIRNIRDLDLNLLVALEVLLEELNISEAAKRLSVTQPAMSNILSRLRKTFDDPLLVRSKGTMLPTPLAVELTTPIGIALTQIRDQVIKRKPFDPKISKHTFNVALHDYEGLLIMPKFGDSWRNSYPNICIQSKSPTAMHPIDELINGTIDFSTGPTLVEREKIYRKKIITDSFVCMVSSQSNLAKGKMTLDKYTNAQHIYIAPHGGMSGKVDEFLHSKGLARTVRFAVSEFSIVPWVIMQGDLVVTLPEKAAKQFATIFPLKIFKLPLDLPMVNIYLSWHERTHKSLPHLWLREQIEKILR